MVGRSLLNTTVGEYRLVDFLGAGGMGEVYRAVHLKLGRVVAVKVMTSAIRSQGLIERFFNEARIQSSLHHRSIAMLYDFLEVDGQPCIIMEYVDGQALSDRLKLGGPLRLPEALSIFATVVEGVQYIHSNGVVHRDIKSNNIKINLAGQVKLLDFGIARVESGPRMTATGDVIGTLEYLSPEQIRGGNADVRSDIWALGVLLYEMVTGHVPFEAATLGDLCDKISKAVYVQPSVINPSVPREVEGIIARCLKRSPGDRYQSAQQLLDDVLLVSQGAPVAARPRGKLAWVMIPAAAAVLVLLFVVLMVTVLAPHPGPESVNNTPTLTTTNSNSNQRARSERPAELKEVRIDASEGPAKVYLNGAEVGSTPYTLNAKAGDRVNLTLKRDGFVDKEVDLTVTENPRPYTFTLSKLEAREP
ncbi:MAG TPA: serine/threonine-protein kinase [Blastocatellia bacterium]|nr:serine/threonine-protein kinase [Blastocatellia bacterium]